MVCWGNRFIRRSSSTIGWSTRVCNISNISTVSISNLVVNSLKSTIRKSNRVGSRCSISITVLSSIILRSRVIISYSILISIYSRFIIGRFIVCRGTIGGFSMDNRGFVCRGRGYNNRGVVDRSGSVGGSRSIGGSGSVGRSRSIGWSRSVDWSRSIGRSRSIRRSR